MPTIDELDAAYNLYGRQSEEWLEMVTRAWPLLRAVIGAAQEVPDALASGKAADLHVSVQDLALALLRLESTEEEEDAVKPAPAVCTHTRITFRAKENHIVCDACSAWGPARFPVDGVTAQRKVGADPAVISSPAYVIHEEWYKGAASTEEEEKTPIGDVKGTLRSWIIKDLDKFHEALQGTDTPFTPALREEWLKLAMSAWPEISAIVKAAQEWRNALPLEDGQARRHVLTRTEDALWYAVDVFAYPKSPIGDNESVMP